MLDWLLPTTTIAATAVAAAALLAMRARREGSTIAVGLPLPRCAPGVAARPLAAGPVAPAAILSAGDIAEKKRELRAATVVDRSILDEQRATFGDERLRRFLSLLREELRRRRSALGAAALAGDRAGLAQHAHAVASAAGNLGFTALLDRGRALEVDFMDLPVEAIPEALRGLQIMIDDAAAAIAGLDAELARGAELAGAVEPASAATGM